MAEVYAVEDTLPRRKRFLIGKLRIQKDFTPFKLLLTGIKGMS
jgi:hypothetical protein